MDEKGISFAAHITGLRSNVTGGWKFTVEVFEADSETVKALVDYDKRNAQVALVRLPE